MFTNKKREGINRFVCDVFLYVAETPKAYDRTRTHLPVEVQSLLDPRSAN